MSPARRWWTGQWLVAVVIGVMALIAGLSGGFGWEALRYERAAILEGELWRLVSGHWLHLGWSHLGLNLAGLLLVWLLWGKALKSLEWTVGVLWIAVVQSLLLLALHPDIQWYVGLSGLLHGLFAVGALRQIAGEPLVAGVSLMALAGKLLLEFGGSTGGAVSSGAFPVVGEAHLYGVVSGVVYVVLLRSFEVFKSANAGATVDRD